jgi:hypothetical protein
MKQNSTTLSSLVRLHADLGGRIFENRKQAQKLAQDVVHLEAGIDRYKLEGLAFLHRSGGATLQVHPETQPTRLVASFNQFERI